MKNKIPDTQPGALLAEYAGAMIEGRLAYLREKYREVADEELPKGMIWLLIERRRAQQRDA